MADEKNINQSFMNYLYHTDCPKEKRNKRSKPKREKENNGVEEKECTCCRTQTEQTTRARGDFELYERKFRIQRNIFFFMLIFWIIVMIRISSR